MSTPEPITPDSFKVQLSTLTAQLVGRALDAELDQWLNTMAPPAAPLPS